MSISAKLFVDDQEYNILEYNLKFYQETDGNNKPLGNFKGGHFNIKVETIKNSLLLEWMVNSDSMKKVKIVFPSRTGTSKSRTIELLDTYCVENNKAFSATNPEPLTTNLTLSPASMIENGEVMFSKSWRVTDPTPRERKPAEEKDEEKKLILSFTAKSDEIKDGKFGFDKFDEDFKKIYDGTDFTAFENEYNPIKVYGEKYFPVWVSMRKGQTITLDVEQIKLGKVKTKNYALYNEIKFEDHPDFTFSPANLKDAKQVRITCNTSNATTAQIKLEADNETVGAINFFYPVPKEVNVRWVVVNFNKGDKEKINAKFNNETLSNYFNTAFNPILIDIKITNVNSETLELTLPITNPAEQTFIDGIKTNLETGSIDNVKQDEKSKIKLIASLNGLHLGRQKGQPNDEIYLYLTNLKSSSQKESPTDSEQIITSSNNGGTIGTVCLMFLGNDRQLIKPQVEIPHEVMHALGLEHTFKAGEKHIFKIKSTRNYMDYDNPKESTFYYQWKQLHL